MEGLAYRKTETHPFELTLPDVISKGPDAADWRGSSPSQRTPNEFGPTAAWGDCTRTQDFELTTTQQETTTQNRSIKITGVLGSFAHTD